MASPLFVARIPAVQIYSEHQQKQQGSAGSAQVNGSGGSQPDTTRSSLACFSLQSEDQQRSETREEQRRSSNAWASSLFWQGSGHPLSVGRALFIFFLNVTGPLNRLFLAKHHIPSQKTASRKTSCVMAELLRKPKIFTSVWFQAPT